MLQGLTKKQLSFVSIGTKARAATVVECKALVKASKEKRVKMLDLDYGWPLSSLKEASYVAVKARYSPSASVLSMINVPTRSRCRASTRLLTAASMRFTWW